MESNNIIYICADPAPNIPLGDSEVDIEELVKNLEKIYWDNYKEIVEKLEVKINV